MSKKLFVGSLSWGTDDEALRRALPDQPAPARERAEKPSRWARLAAEIEADPVHLDDHSEQLERDAREFREGFVFEHDAATARTIVSKLFDKSVEGHVRIREKQ